MTNDDYRLAYIERHGEEPYAGHCAAMWTTGHQCENEPGHEGHHDRNVSGTWVRWCDDPSTCDDPTCDLKEYGMKTDILGAADIYLTFNEKNEVMCDASRCKNRARVVLVTERDDPPYRGGGTQAQHLKIDDKYVVIWKAKCGVHDRGGHWGDIAIPSSLFTNEPRMDWDLVRRCVEKDHADRAERAARDAALDAERRREVANLTEMDFQVEAQEERRNGTRWVVKGHSYDDSWVGVAWVELDNDGTGIWHINTGGYSGYVGKGIGSPALARIIARLLLKAAETAEQNNGGEEA